MWYNSLWLSRWLYYTGCQNISVTVDNSPIQDLTHLDNHIPSTYEMTPGFKHFTIVEKTEDKECDFLLSVVS